MDNILPPYGGETGPLVVLARESVGFIDPAVDTVVAYTQKLGNLGLAVITIEGYFRKFRYHTTFQALSACWQYTPGRPGASH